MRSGQQDDYEYDYEHRPLRGLSTSTRGTRRGGFVAAPCNLTRPSRYGSRTATVHQYCSRSLAAVLAAVLLCACSRSEPVRVVPQTGPTQPRRVAFHPTDPSRLLVLEATGMVSVWKLGQTAKESAKILQLFANALDASFSAEGNGIVTVGQNGRVTWWDAEGRQIWTRSDAESSPARAVALAGKDGLVASGSGDGVLKLWTSDGTAQGQQKAHDGAILSLALAPQGNLIASVGMDQLVKVWKRGQGTGAPLEERVLVGAVKPQMKFLLASLLKLDPMWGWDHALAFSPAGDVIAAADYEGGVRLWNVDGTPRTAQLKGHQGQYVRAVAFSPRGDLWASAGFDGTIKIWDLAGTPRATMVAHEGPALSVSFSADGETVATAGFDDRVKLWKTDGTLIGELPRGQPNQILSLAFPPAGEPLVAGTSAGTLRLWNLDGFPKSPSISTQQGPVSSVAISPRGNLIASGGQDGTVRLWDANAAPKGKTERDHLGQVLSLAFSPRGDTFASGSRAAASLWNLDGTLRADLQGLREIIFALAYAPQGDLIAGVDLDGGLMIWNADGSAHAGPVYGKHWGSAFAVAFAPDGALIATAGQDQTVRLWTPDASQVGEPLTGHTAPVHAVAFSPNGDRLISGGLDGTLRIWKLPSREVQTVEIGLPIDDLRFSDHGLRARVAGGYLLFLDGDFKPAAWMLINPEAAVVATEDGYYAGSGNLVRGVDLYRGAADRVPQEEAVRRFSAARVDAQTGGS